MKKSSKIEWQPFAVKTLVNQHPPMIEVVNGPAGALTTKWSGEGKIAYSQSGTGTETSTERTSGTRTGAVIVLDKIGKELREHIVQGLPRELREVQLAPGGPPLLDAANSRLAAVDDSDDDNSSDSDSDWDAILDNDLNGKLDYADSVSVYTPFLEPGAVVRMRLGIDKPLTPSDVPQQKKKKKAP